MADMSKSVNGYQPGTIEAKWQKYWLDHESFIAQDDTIKPKYYCLDMFPYPSAQGLHVGHPEGYTATDIVSRYRRMHGSAVLHPMGWDAFGLPAENYAIKTGVHPDISTHQNIQTFIRQIRALGFSYDWRRELDTSSPEYYKWTQWMFLQMYEHGLAYKKKAKVNWCNSCQTVLANEQVVDGKCERSRDEVVHKDLEQWFFKITDYADRLLNDLNIINWPEPIKMMQRNWIGRSEGVNFRCKIKGFDYEFDVYDSVPQTFMAQTFSVIAADHPILKKIIQGTPQEQAVLECIDRIQKRKIVDRTATIDGIFTGFYIENPYGTGDLPLWVASFAVMDYGSGIVNCSAHDERDFAFAKHFNIPLRPVMFPADPVAAEKVRNLEYCYHHADDGVLAAPEQFRGRQWGEARQDIINHIEAVGLGKRAINYKIRDWLISRQRYWGAPIPIVYDPDGKPHPVKEEHLPIVLPTDVDYTPKGTSPLGSSKEYRERAEQLYGKGWHFEVDTMDTFVCSSWYYLRYCDPKNEQQFAAPEKLAKWLPVDLYVGGAEHAVLHLLYARFFHKALQDFGYIPSSVGPEPFAALRNQGMILGADHQKMSKSRGNVVNPDDIVNEFGADTMRLYEMFIGPFEDVKPWQPDSIRGVYRFLDRVFRLTGNVAAVATVSAVTERVMHLTTKLVTEHIEQFRFNTAISQMMIYANHLAELDTVPQIAFERLIVLLTPFAPHITAELWEKLGHTAGIWEQTWPTFDATKLEVDTMTVVIQVNGKVRDQLTIARRSTEAEVVAQAQSAEKVHIYITGKTIRKTIYVPNKLVNFVV